MQDEAKQMRPVTFWQQEKNMRPGGAVEQTAYDSLQEWRDSLLASGEISSGALSKEVECIADLQGSLSRTGPRNYILREIFYTGKHEWYTRYREERLRSVAAPDPKRRK
ncbi:Ribosomal protein S32 domain containing protein [Dirofilaria immitis]|nr:Ribosomal protein S32 domain containing protein [Dirofilaria immitis]